MFIQSRLEAWLITRYGVKVEMRQVELRWNQWQRLVGRSLVGIAGLVATTMSAQAQEIDLDYLCQTSPFNSRCQTQAVKPPNAEVIKLRLTDLAGVSEWVRLERTGRQVKLLHTTVAPSGFAKAFSAIAGIPSAFSNSDAARGVGIAAGLPPIAHTWYDHLTSRLLFQPDGCASATCVITGTNSLELAEDTDLLKGRFTIEYAESNLQRSVTFRLPPTRS
jgi:hypothetical protein